MKNVCDLFCFFFLNSQIQKKEKKNHEMVWLYDGMDYNISGKSRTKIYNSQNIFENILFTIVFLLFLNVKKKKINNGKV